MNTQDTCENRVALSYQQRMQLDFEVIARRPRKGVANGLCAALGMFGAHRFYLGERQTAIIMLILGISVIGLPVSLLWAVTDLFRIPQIIDKRSAELREELVAKAGA